MPTVLWLTSWYPNKTNPFSGDFIQRQARAAALFNDIRLIFITKDIPESPGESALAQPEQKLVSGFPEYIIYYPKSKFQEGLFSRFHSLRQYLKQHRIIFRQWKKNGAMPAIVHVQVAMKAGLIALYLKKRYGIPYVITEHWSGYLPGSRDALKNKGFAYRFLVKRIFRQASWFLPVTRNLGDIVNRTITRIPTQVIPNVVDTTLFHDRDNTVPRKFRFIHVSMMGPEKNPEGIISTFEKLTMSGFDAELALVGPPSESVLQLLEQKPGLQGRIFLAGEISYGAVAEQLKKSSAFVLFSEVESLPCVILESLCCGIPVISSRVGGIPEVIGKENGVLVEPGNEVQLEEAMKNMITGYSAYNKSHISRNAQALYNYHRVGQQFASIYHQVINHQLQPAE